MTWIEAILLGIVQGLTEFLPISSSAHLRLTSQVLFGNDPGAAFTAVTQLGTEAAVLIYFARDIGYLISTWFRGLADAEVRRSDEYRLAWLVIIGTLPIVVLGVLLKDQIETVARNLYITATMLIVFGVLLGLAERVGRQKTELHGLKVSDGVILGFAQAMALVPGVSRSGGTITAGLFLGLTRPAAVRYSFLLAIPAVIGAGVFELFSVFDKAGSAAGAQATGAQIAVATLIAFVLGYAAIAWLLRYVAKHSVYVFVGYRLVLGLWIFFLLATGVVSAT